MSEKQGVILIADDEQDILEILNYNLTKEGYTVYTAKNGNDAIEKAKQVNPQLIILDVMMPDKTGVQVCDILRKQESFKETMIVFLTAKTDEASHIKGLESGGDDYINKPISPKVLISRVNALFRRINKDENNKAIHAGNMIIDPNKYVVMIEDNEIVLAKKEFELLYLLAGKPGRVFLRNEILNSVWGEEVIVGDRTIDVHIRKIRHKTGVDCITTVKGVGYKFSN